MCTTLGGRPLVIMPGAICRRPFRAREMRQHGPRCARRWPAAGTLRTRLSLFTAGSSAWRDRRAPQGYRKMLRSTIHGHFRQEVWPRSQRDRDRERCPGFAASERSGRRFCIGAEERPSSRAKMLAGATPTLDRNPGVASRTPGGNRCRDGFASNVTSRKCCRRVRLATRCATR